MLHSSISLEANLSHYQSMTHLLEIIVWQSGAAFRVELHSGLSWSWQRKDKPWITWTNQQSFGSLVEAYRYLSEIMANPRQFASQNLPSNVQYYWSRSSDSQVYKVIERYDRPTNFDPATLAGQVARGEAQMPPKPLRGEVIRYLWGRPEPELKETLWEFAFEAEPVYGEWGHWKWLYKQAEAADDPGLLPVFLWKLDTLDLTQDRSKNFKWLERGPSTETLEYMKRRGRRFLRKLAVRDPARYVERAFQLLKDNKDKTKLDLTNQWLTLDVLYGRSGRYVQKNHSRGGYSPGASRLSLSLKAERAAEEWLKQPDRLREIYQTEMPWQISEWALKMLRAGGQVVPAVARPIYARFLQSESPLLIQEAVRQIIESHEPGQPVAAEIMACAYFLANGRQRRHLNEKLIPKSPLSAWDQKFAAALAGLLGQNRPSQRLAPRWLDAAVLLGNHYAGALPDATLLPAIPAIIATGRAELRPLVEAVINRLHPDNILDLLKGTGGLNEEQRRYLLELLQKVVGQKVIQYRTAASWVFAASEWVREDGWELLLAAQVNPATFNELWANLLGPYTAVAVLSSALANPKAFELLMKTPERVQALQERFTKNPALLNQLTGRALNILMKNGPLSFSMQLIGTMLDELWAQVKTRLVEDMRLDGRLGAFWQAAWQAIPADTGGKLAGRILNDPLLRRTFEEVAEPSFMETSEPVFSLLLAGWMGSRPDLFEQDSPNLLQAAMSKLLEVRLLALRRINEVGMSMPFALRLLESGLPETVARGKDFFEKATPENELEYALAICDSPDKATQFYGREYVQKRWERLPVDELLQKLAEHPDVPVQELVATRLLDEPGRAEQVTTGAFDRVVLRSRNRGRKVKELVKQRVSQAAQPAVDKATLLEMARSRTPRDAEWAWQQLARLAQAGETIEGLTIEGVNGV
jgi:hypothetical protein